MIGEVGLVLMAATVGWFMRYLPEEAPVEAPAEKKAEAAPGLAGGDEGPGLAGGDGGPGFAGDARPDLAVKVEEVGDEQFWGNKAQRHRSHEGYSGYGGRERGGRRRQDGRHRRR